MRAGRSSMHYSWGQAKKPYADNMGNLILILYCSSHHRHASERPALGSADGVDTVKLIAGWLILSDDPSLSPSLNNTHHPPAYACLGGNKQKSGVACSNPLPSSPSFVAHLHYNRTIFVFTRACGMCEGMLLDLTCLAMNSQHLSLSSGKGKRG